MISKQSLIVPPSKGDKGQPENTATTTTNNTASTNAANSNTNNTNTYSSGSVKLSAAATDKPAPTAANLKKMASRTIAVAPVQHDDNVHTLTP